jgi:predicted metalloprotease
MKWQMGRRSDNVEDQRGAGGIPQGAVAGGGIGVIVLALIAMLLGVDPSIILNTMPVPQEQPALVRPGSQPRNSGDEQLADFVSVVLADTEDTWQAIFPQLGRTYLPPKLVLFSGAVNSACGFAQAAVGPFYCPNDRKIYIDLNFYQDLKQRHQAPGDFAQAYVIAHEVGHHVQNLLGLSGKVSSLQQQVSKPEANQLSVRLELQADCLAGMWTSRAQQERQVLEPGDIEEALNAASQIGDDRLQAAARGYVTPDSFTHGSSAQRVQWFKQGFQASSIKECNTFAASRL